MTWKNMILIGFMGTGKSTVGRLVAQQLDLIFVDTDACIAEEQDQPISVIFQQQGEAAFRKMETQMLRRTLARGEQVIATGGGAVLAEENRRMMLQGGFVVALKASEATIIKRVSGNASRPLLAGDITDRVRRLLKEREGVYDFAHLTIDTDGLTPEEIAGIIVNTKERS